MRARLHPSLLALSTASLILSGVACSPPNPTDKTADKTATAEKNSPPPVKEPVFKDHPQGVVYVANAGSNTLTMLDRVSMEVVGEPIKTGHQPGSVAASPATGRLFFPARYVPEDEIKKSTPKDGIPDNFRSMSLWGIDPNMGNQIVQKAFVGDPDKEGDPVFLALHPQGEWAAISDGKNNKIEFRDLGQSERQRNATTDVGPGPLGGAFTSDANWYIVANNDPGNTADPDTVSIIDFRSDADGPTEVAKVTVGNNPSYVVTSPDNTLAYVTVTGSDKVVAINLATQQVAGEWSVGAGPVGITRDAAGTFYYVTLKGGQLVKVDAATGQVAGSAEVGASPVGVIIDEPNARLWVANSGDNSVSIVGLGTFAQEKTVKVGDGPLALVLVSNQAAPTPQANMGAAVPQGTAVETAPATEATLSAGDDATAETAPH